jgi:hypothetical protein
MQKSLEKSSSFFCKQIGRMNIFERRFQWGALDDILTLCHDTFLTEVDI